MSTPDVSLVIPAWGTHVTYLPPAIESLLEQEGPRTEIIVVDNASDVPVPPLPPQVRVIRTPQRLPVGGARNAGLDAAIAPAIMFWDADDVMLPGTLRRLCEVLDGDPRVVAVTMDSVRWTPETGPGERWPWPRSVMYALCRRPRLFAIIAQVYCPFTTTGPALMRTAEVRDAGGFASDIAFFEDWALASSLTVRGRIVMLREIARWYRIHDESLTLGHLGHPDEHLWLAGLRRRARTDHRRPRWLKAMLPLFRVHHEMRIRRGRKSTAGVGYYESALADVDGAAGAKEAAGSPSP
ncbi:glycosyltransferase [Conexibacter sp. W3-3-2]|uniref:glycosyltransferase family 2 protein n=1 Tax=Conexibacter sp. W3-3-2 TaxID=2675227 RepID=UPI0012B6E6FE|nr:glycosyltransferase family 2 protein [Conexibacter sp. W3-3-2]MTD43088.1 glycosyltransferase [Conexibacter sp. W3-3-2]